MPTKTYSFWLLGMFSFVWLFSGAQSPVAIIDNAEFIDGLTLCTGEEVHFISSSSNLSDTATFYWDFGTGAVPGFGEGPGPHQVEYTTAGLQEVLLVVDNDNGFPADSAWLDFLVTEPPSVGIELISLGWNYDAYEDQGESFFVHCNSSSAANFAFELTSPTALNHTVDWGDGSPVWQGVGAAFVVDHEYDLGAFTLTYTVEDEVNGCSSVEVYSVFNGTAPNISFQNSKSCFWWFNLNHMMVVSVASDRI